MDPHPITGNPELLVKSGTGINGSPSDWDLIGTVACRLRTLRTIADPSSSHIAARPRRSGSMPAAKRFRETGHRIVRRTIGAWALIRGNVSANDNARQSHAKKPAFDVV